jgi:hypothetical protein
LVLKILVLKDIGFIAALPLQTPHLKPGQVVGSYRVSLAAHSRLNPWVN